MQPERPRCSAQRMRILDRREPQTRGKTIPLVLKQLSGVRRTTCNDLCCIKAGDLAFEYLVNYKEIFQMYME